MGSLSRRAGSPQTPGRDVALETLSPRLGGFKDGQQSAIGITQGGRLVPVLVSWWWHRNSEGSSGICGPRRRFWYLTRPAATKGSVFCKNELGTSPNSTSCQKLELQVVWTWRGLLTGILGSWVLENVELAFFGCGHMCVGPGCERISGLSAFLRPWEPV